MHAADTELLDDSTFLTRLREVGERGYHARHPFHGRMNRGELSPDEIRSWVANRFEYQTIIPRKDAAILANCPVREVRVTWARRLADHDGPTAGEGGGGGGIEAWLRLAEASGLDRRETIEGRHVVPGVRFAAGAYFEFARTRPWPVAVASSLTELFAPDLMCERLDAFRSHYGWVAPWGLEYFEGRPARARRDSREAVDLTLAYCDTPDLRREAIRALSFKCDVLWAMLDAIEAAPGVGGTGVRPVIDPGSATTIDRDDRPRLSAGVRVARDRARGRDVLLGPERIRLLSGTAAEVLEHCDGHRTVGEIAAVLAARHGATVDVVVSDVVAFLEALRASHNSDFPPLGGGIEGGSRSNGHGPRGTPSDSPFQGGGFC